MNDRTLRIAYLTAGAGGMYCGSCMHDNTLAAALSRRGIDVQLIPTYTPIRTDEDNVSVDRVFFGGISVFLEQKLPRLAWLSGQLGGLLDQPWLIRGAAARAVHTDARDLGALTVSMLRGTAGHQKREVEKLARWLAAPEHRPQLLVLSNMLIGGCIPTLKARLGCPVLVTLQGDDIFLDALPEPYRQQALGQIAELAPHVDSFIANSRYYADFMSRYLAIPAEKFRITPLGIDVRDFAAPPADRSARPPTIGYLARLAPEKGLHRLIDAFLLLREAQETGQVQLRIAGWLGEHQRGYAEQQFERLRNAGLERDFQYVGSVDRLGKAAFLQEIDVLSVPTEYCEPKGLFVLEALAAGVPVVQPEHGAFPELIRATGGGRLVPPGDAPALAAALSSLLQDEAQRRALGSAGRQRVHALFHADRMADEALAVYREFLGTAGVPSAITP